MLSHAGGVVAAPAVAASPAAEQPLVEPHDPALVAALDRAFAETGSPRKFTKAVVVMKHGRIVAERYADDHSVDTPILGFSATKSVINALAGILVREGRLKLDAPAPIAQWQSPGDPRSAITVNHLLRHTAGLALGSSLAASIGSAWEPVNWMKFLERDTAVRGPMRSSRPCRAVRGTTTTATPCIARTRDDRRGRWQARRICCASHSANCSRRSACASDAGVR